MLHEQPVRSAPETRAVVRIGAMQQRIGLHGDRLLAHGERGQDVPSAHVDHLHGRVILILIDNCGSRKVGIDRDRLWIPGKV